VKSPMNKGRGYKIPGVGLAGDWPGAWTQTYAQVDTEAGPAGFDKDYFLQQVAGLSQIAGDLMRVDPKVIDLGWGQLKSAILNLKDTAFITAAEAPAQRQMLMTHYVAAFRGVEKGSAEKGAASLKELSAAIAAHVVPEQRAELDPLVSAQRSVVA